MAPAVQPHHHRSTTKILHKAFKSRHATKSDIRDASKGKVETQGRNKNYKSLHQQVMSKIDRKNQGRQRQQAKHQEHLKSANVFSGHNGAPRIIALVPLSADADTTTAIRNLSQSVGEETEPVNEGLYTVRIDRFKQSLGYLQPSRHILSTLDACRVADFVIFILSPDRDVDEEGEHLLRAIEGQGVSNVLTVVQGLEAIQPPKKRLRIHNSLRSFISHFFPHQEKIYSLDSSQECANVIRALCTSTPRGIGWREDRSWMLVENMSWTPSENIEIGTAVLTGVIRGKGLKSNRLLHVGDWGDFQIEKITDATLPVTQNGKNSDLATGIGPEPFILQEPSLDQDELVDLAPEEIDMGNADDQSEAPTERRGVLLDDHHYFSDDETHLPEAPKRLPKGTSSYQAAWFLGDMSDSGSDWEDNVEDVEGGNVDVQPLPQDGMEGLENITLHEPTEVGPSEYPQSEMFLDPSPEDEAGELADYRARRKDEAEEDLEFPDEIELHPNVLARERLSRYRGLKSLRTSKWETEEDKAHEPEDWNRLLQVPDYKAARSQATREALVGGVPPGTRVQIHLRAVPQKFRQAVSSSSPLTAFSLLRHEYKRTVMNYSVTLNSDYPTPLRSKEELVVQCGPRRFIVNPLFSAAGATQNDVHKFDRYLHPGRTAIATIICPMTWGAVPTLFFRRSRPDSTAQNPSDQARDSSQTLELIATGTSLPPSSSRVIAKRVILTGHPYKIHKKIVTIRYMFFNSEDVHWFKALQLWTRRGRSGFIKESLGTHGYFKATFDQKINPQDSVGVSLYKRVWPRTSRAWRVTDAEELRNAKSPADMEVDGGAAQNR